MLFKNRDATQPGARTHPGAQTPRKSEALFGPASSEHLQPTIFRMQPHQRIVLGNAPDDYVYAIVSGVIIARAAQPASELDFIELNYSQDVLSCRTIPSLGERQLLAATQAEVWRITAPALAAFLAGDAERTARFERDRACQLAASALHTAALATLEGPARFAGFLLEMALRVGVASGSTVAIELPLSRTEMAQYLALNADTLSRLMSRFKSDGLVSQKSRHHIVLRDWRALAAQCPIAPAILALDRGRPSPLV